MTTTFRTAGPWGAGAGADLTPTQVDQNFYDKETRITAIEAAGVAVGISTITMSGGQLIITMTDASVFSFDLATLIPAWTPQGQWQALSLYSANDVVYAMGGAYLVNVDHTSAATFDPEEIIGTVEAYTLILPFAPVLGFTRSAATFTPALEDANSYNRMTNAAGCVVTIDPAVNFPAWCELTFRNEATDTGAVTMFTIDPPGTINGVDGFNNQTAGRGSVVTLKRIASTDDWDIMGRLEPATA